MIDVKRELLVARTLRHLFDATADVDKWGAFLESISDLFETNGAYFFYFDFEWEKLNFHVHYGYDQVDEKLMKVYEETVVDDPRVPFVRQHPEMPLTDHMCVDEETRTGSRFYKEFLKPAGVEHNLFVELPNDDKTSAFFGIMRGPKGLPFDEADRDLFGELIPSMKRAVELHRRLAILDFDNRAAFEGFDQFPFGFVLTDETGNVRFANRTAREISAAKDGFTLDGNGFSTGDPTDRSAMLGYISEAVLAARRDEILPAEGQTLFRPSGAPPYEVVMSTVWGNHLRFELGHLDDPIVAIHITDPERPLETPRDLLQRLYGLTPAEARVVERIIAGETVAEIADKLDNSQQTIRQHLRIAFEKTDTKRQSQLIKRVLSSPIWIKADRLRENYSDNQIRTIR